MTGRRALVTGAARGIGRAIAARLAADGATVAAADVLAVEAAERIVPVACDLADPAAVDALPAQAERALRGPVDVLVNNAAVAAPAPLAALDRDALRRHLAVNLEAPILLMGALTPGMAARGWGRVVNVTSVHGERGEPGSLAYDAAKAGLDQATRTAAAELRGGAVLVNAVAPGFVDTAMAVVGGRNELEGDAFRAIYVEGGRLPAGRAADPAEIARVVAWLAGPENTYVHGHVLTVDGGLTAVL